MREDNLGFATGSLVALSISAAMMFGFYQWAYNRGAESEKCKEKHGYEFRQVRWFGKVANK